MPPNRKYGFNKRFLDYKRQQLLVLFSIPMAKENICNAQNDQQRKSLKQHNMQELPSHLDKFTSDLRL